MAVVAALLLNLPITTGVAAAADNIGHSPEKQEDAKIFLKQKKAEKIIVMLNSMGIDNPEIIEFVNTVNNRTKDGYLMLHQENITEGTVSLRYKLKPAIGIKQLELQYKPQDSNMEYRLHSNSVMVNYKFSF